MPIKACVVKSPFTYTISFHKKTCLTFYKVVGTTYFYGLYIQLAQILSSYYTLMIWFPELFNRYEEFEHNFPNTSASVCDVSGIVVTDDGKDPFDCGSTIEASVFMHTLIVGLACIPTSLWLPLCVHKLGAKFFLSEYFSFYIFFI